MQADVGSQTARMRTTAQGPLRDGMIVGNSATDAEIADIIAFLESLTDEGFLTNPAYDDPWPADHPAVVNRALP